MDALPVAALRRIPVALIETPEGRLAMVRPEWVEMIRASTAEVGLLQPIVVQEMGAAFVLIAGAQRLAATRAAGATDTKARLRGTAHEDHGAGLRALAAATPEMQAQALDLLLAAPPQAGGVADALLLAGGGVIPSFTDRLLNSTMSNFAKLPKASQRAFLNANERLIREHAKAKGWF